MPDPSERFWPKVNKNGPVPGNCPDLGRCWVWMASTQANGYGRFWDAGSVVPAHRFAYELLVGPIPTGLEPDHLCRNRACVNPTHIEPVTRSENARRGEVGRWLRSRGPYCKHGHEWTPENTRIYKGSRYCRACAHEYKRTHKQRVAA